ncbi:MAG: hypothetical protein JF571_12435 [Asticcacaulis sp.]|nr:hypothetical protein [Asticcacaulis sp.]
MTGAEIARFHLFAALLWAVCTVIAGRRARSEAVHWKVLAWPACAAAGFALVVHMASPDPAEQLVMGALAAVAAFTMLFTAFLPDAADLVANVQMTRPSEPF